MIAHPNKPIVFGIDHSQYSVNHFLRQFKEAIRGKKTLYIELTREQLSRLPNYPSRATDILPVANIYELHAPDSEAAFLRLAHTALEAGLQVVPLDDQKLVDKWWRKRKVEVSGDYMRYHNRARREKAWAKKLAPANISAVVIAHPEHAEEIINLLEIPKRNVAFMERPIDYSQAESPRRCANDAKRRIEMKRLAGRLRKAQTRKPWNPPKRKVRG